jgi:hypothetical protein
MDLFGTKSFWISLRARGAGVHKIDSRILFVVCFVFCDYFIFCGAFGWAFVPPWSSSFSGRRMQATTTSIKNRNLVLYVVRSLWQHSQHFLYF